jgi:DNA phosphorothioation-dependent restriction protein DptG
VLSNCSLCNKHYNDTIVICQLVCVTDSWGTHESFVYPIFFLKNECDKLVSKPC